MNRNDYILIIDSGNGGEFVLKNLVKNFPHENFLFFKDIDNCPYGNKSKKRLFNISKKNIEFFLKNYNIKLVIFACNTISCTILKELKKEFNDIYLLGLIPNIDKALESGKKTLVLSTYSTLKRGKINKKYKKNKLIKFVGFKDLAKRIDDNLYQLDNLMPYLIKRLKNYRDYKNIVLGCSHFSLIAKQLKVSINCDVVFYNNIDILINNLESILKALCLKNKQVKNGEIIIKTKLEKSK